MNEKETAFLKRRIEDLALKCHLQNFFTNTFFLNLHEQTVFHSMTSLPPVQHITWGGYEGAERKIVCFLPYYTDLEDFDQNACFDYLRIFPLHKKFAEPLSHRDYLGALMHIGIERHMMGDICITEEGACLIVLRSISALILEELSFVKHTKVGVEKVMPGEISRIYSPRPCRINISSPRLDAVIASVYRLSRTQALKYIDSEKVFINSVNILSHSKLLSEGDMVSVRGLGRFCYLGREKSTKKARLFAEIELYD